MRYLSEINYFNNFNKMKHSINERRKNMEQIVNQNINNDIQAFINSIKKKSKSFYKRYPNSIAKLARHISPAYRDFVNKLLSNCKLKIYRYASDGVCNPTAGGNIYSLSKRAKNEIKFGFEDYRIFAHEIGHSVDFLFGYIRPLSSSVVIYDDKTLFDVFNEEFSLKHKELYEFVMNEYRNSIDSNIYKGAFDIFINNMPTYLSLRKEKDHKVRKRIQKKLYECGFVEVYYQINTKKCFKVLEQNYVAILDALSSKYDTQCLKLVGHSLEYYKFSKEMPTQEFFANVFADKITGNHNRYDHLIELMPQSFDAFEKLFVVIYDRIQNNKRFTDLKLCPFVGIPEGEVEEN